MHRALSSSQWIMNICSIALLVLNCSLMGITNRPQCLWDRNNEPCTVKLQVLSFDLVQLTHCSALSYNNGPLGCLVGHGDLRIATDSTLESALWTKWIMLLIWPSPRCALSWNLFEVLGKREFCNAGWGYSVHYLETIFLRVYRGPCLRYPAGVNYISIKSGHAPFGNRRLEWRLQWRCRATWTSRGTTLDGKSERIFAGKCWN